MRNRESSQVKQTPIVINAAVTLAFSASVSYYYGWVYWSNYYHQFGLPWAFASAFGTERLLMAGANHLLLLGWRAGVLAIAIIGSVRLLRWLDRRFAGGWCARRERYVGMLVQRELRRFSGKCMAAALTVVLLYHVDRLILAEFLRGAKQTAETNLHMSTKSVKLQVRQPASLPVEGRLELFESREGKHYLFHYSDRDSKPSVVIVPESEVVSILIEDKTTP